MSDVSTVQQEIARDISVNLRLRLTVDESNRLNRAPTQSPEAYDLYLRERYYWNKRTPDAFKRAVKYFTAATDKDPSYALAWSGLADAYSLMARWSLSKEARPKAHATALKAVELDDTLAEAHTSLGLVKENEWDWTGAEKEFRRAVELNSHYATAHHWYARLLAVLDKKVDAITELKRAIELDPLNLPINNSLGSFYVSIGRFDDAIHQYRKNLEIDPKYASAHAGLAKAYFEQHNYREAFLEWKEVAAILGDAEGIDESNAMWKVFQRAGPLAAMKTLAETEIHAASYRYVAPSEIASIYFEAGEKDRGFAWLERAYNEHDDGLIEMGEYRAIAPYRSDSRFANLLHRMRLPQ